MKKVVVFDMDGVLIDSEKIMYRYEAKALKKYKVENAEQIAFDIVGLNGKDKIDYIAKQINNEKKARRAYNLFGFYLWRYMTFHKVPIKPGVFEILSYLRKEGYEIAIASALKINYLKMYLLKTGIGKYTDEILGGDQVKARKPDPEVYIQVCKNLNVTTNECIAVEDSIVGARAAIDAGLKTVIIPDLQQPDEYNKKNAFMIKDSLVDLLKYIKENEKNS